MNARCAGSNFRLQFAGAHEHTAAFVGMLPPLAEGS
jgi:hypothetical protein